MPEKETAARNCTFRSAGRGDIATVYSANDFNQTRLKLSHVRFGLSEIRSKFLSHVEIRKKFQMGSRSSSPDTSGYD